ncbi:MAG: molybdopterin-dependent oxidoreductase [Gammaproteobacteria bacterium]|nr:molybdopterin-dependent oxidoreductase [Gammaproteobacteria bacterium]
MPFAVRADADRSQPDRVVRTVCSPNCSGTCGIDAWVKDDRIVKIEPAAFPDPGFERICLKGIAMAMQRIEHPDRLRHPLRRRGARGAGEWERISWEQALDDIAAALGRIRARDGARANAWMTMSGNYGFKATTVPERIANCLGGTVLTHGGMMGDLNCAMGYLPLLGVGSTCNDLADLKHARYIIIFGRNAADTDHSEMRFLFDAMEAGAKVVVVDPRYSRTAAKADEWVSPRPGTDAALVLGMINVIVAEGLIAEDYIRQHTNAPFLVRCDSGALLRARDIGADGEAFVVWDAVRGLPCPAASARNAELRGRWRIDLGPGGPVECCTAFELMLGAWAPYTPERAAQICEVPAGTIRHLAREYARSDRAWLWAGAGPQRYHHGHLVHRAYVTLGALTGNIGKPHAGVNCLDGAHMRLTFFPPQEWMAPGGRRGHSLPGVHMLDIISRGDPYPIKSLWITAYGMGSQSPNFDRFVQEALPQLELFVVTEQLMTPAARHADIVLPCVSYYEEEMDLVAGGEHWYLQLRQRAIPPVGESRNDYEIFAGVCERLGEGEHWRMSNEEVCRFVLEHHDDPVIRAIDWKALRRDGVARVEIPRPHVPFADLRFPTPSGRIELYTERLAPFGQGVLVYEEPLESSRRPLARRLPLVLISPKHVHSTHSQHTMLPWIREQLPEPRLEMHPRDARARAIGEGDRVRVYNDRGSLSLHASLSEGVKPGMVVVPQGFWREHFVAGHFADLGHIVRNPVQDVIIETNYPVWDILVEVAREAAA